MGMGIKTADQMVTIVADAVGKSTLATALSGAILHDRCYDFLNWGQERICRAYNFDELTILNTSAVTATGVLSYPLIVGTNNLGLIRPKDIETIRLIDNQNSIKLERFHVRKFDQKFPYPVNFAQQSPRIYCMRGFNLEFFRIPDAIYNLYITYPQWPTPFVLASPNAVSDFYYKDQLIITAAILEGYLHFEEYTDAEKWNALFEMRLKDAIHAEGDVDWEPHASEFKTSKGGYQSGEPWLDPYATATDPLYGYAG